MTKKNEEGESKEVKKRLKPKVIIEYFQTGKKSSFFAFIIDKKGDITKTKSKKDENALEAFKKFVAAL